MSIEAVRKHLEKYGLDNKIRKRAIYLSSPFKILF